MSKIGAIISVVTTLGVLSGMGYMIVFPAGNSHDILMMMIGAVVGGWSTMVAFYFSKESANEGD